MDPQDTLRRGHYVPKSGHDIPKSGHYVEKSADSSRTVYRVLAVKDDLVLIEGSIFLGLRPLEIVSVADLRMIKK